MDVKERPAPKIGRSLAAEAVRADENCPTVFPGMGKRIHWDLDDPAAAQGTEDEKLAVFRRVRDEIDEHIKTWLAEPDSLAGYNVRAHLDELAIGAPVRHHSLTPP